MTRILFVSFTLLAGLGCEREPPEATPETAVAEVVERSRTNSLVPGQSEGQSVRSNRRRSEITMDPRAVAASAPGIFVIEF